MENKSILFIDSIWSNSNLMDKDTKSYLDEQTQQLDIIIVHKEYVSSSTSISSQEVNNNLGKTYANLKPYNFDQMQIESFLLEKACKNVPITYVYGQDPQFLSVVNKYPKKFISHQFNSGDKIWSYV